MRFSHNIKTTVPADRVVSALYEEFREVTENRCPTYTKTSARRWIQGGWDIWETDRNSFVKYHEVVRVSPAEEGYVVSYEGERRHSIFSLVMAMVLVPVLFIYVPTYAGFNPKKVFRDSLGNFKWQYAEA